jgi:arabinan endo-1,5-alpha-L-arabinosidase
MKFSLSAAVLLVTMLSAQLGCGGGSSSGGGSGSGPDNGTLTAMNDGFQYKIQNVSSGLLLEVAGQSQTAGALLAQAADDGNGDQTWHFMPMGNDQFNVEYLLTHQVVGITNASQQSGATALQWADNGTPDHLWEFYLLTDGNYLIKNANSSLYLEDRGSDTTPSAVIDQAARATTGTGCSCQEWTLTSTGTSPYPAPLAVSGTGIYVHDPYMLKDPSGTYWLYGTHQTLAFSTDLATFTYTTATSAQGACTTAQGTYWLTDDNRCPIIGPDFTSWTGLQTPPSDNNGENIDVWAPSLMYYSGTYYQYYAIPYEPSTGAEAVIGLATSATPYGPWTDNGYVVTSWTTTSPLPSPNPWGFVTGTTWNAIDPAPFIDASGLWWMSFGSWSDGIHIMQLDPATGLQLQSNLAIPVIAYRPAGEEGSFIYPYIYNGTEYYYYFAPINVCCDGTSSTYRIIVGRSTSPTGPYLDRGGLDLTAGGGTILLSSHGNIYGPGGQSVFTDGTLPTLVYHYYDGNNNGTPTLGINRLSFTSDGWPFVQ